MNLSIRSRPAVRGVLVAAGATLLLTTLVGCSGDKETVESWIKGDDQRYVTTIAKDARTLVQDSGSNGADPAVASHCRQMLDDVKAARAYGELPDKGMQADWKDTLDKIETTASRCLRNGKAGTEGVSLSDAIDVQTALETFADDLHLARSLS